MKKVVFPSLLALVGLTGCSVGTGQLFDVDSKTRFLVSLRHGDQLRPALIMGKSSGEPIHRVIQNAEGKVLFAYDLKVDRGSEDGAFVFHVRPSKQQPTFAAEREIRANMKQESMRVEMLERPGSGETVTDWYLLAKQPEFMSPGAHIMKLHNMVFQYIHGH